MPSRVGFFSHCNAIIDYIHAEAFPSLFNAETEFASGTISKKLVSGDTDHLTRSALPVLPSSFWHRCAFYATSFIPPMLMSNAAVCHPQRPESVKLPFYFLILQNALFHCFVVNALAASTPRNVALSSTFSITCPTLMLTDPVLFLLQHVYRLQKFWSSSVQHSGNTWSLFWTYSNYLLR